VAATQPSNYLCLTVRGPIATPNAPALAAAIAQVHFLALLQFQRTQTDKALFGIDDPVTRGAEGVRAIRPRR
jgi:hypothetical protein